MSQYLIVKELKNNPYKWKYSGIHIHYGGELSDSGKLINNYLDTVGKTSELLNNVKNFSGCHISYLTDKKEPKNHLKEINLKKSDLCFKYIKKTGNELFFFSKDSELFKVSSSIIYVQSSSGAWKVISPLEYKDKSCIIKIPLKKALSLCLNKDIDEEFHALNEATYIELYKKYNFPIK